jgi:Flp pilus assembly protein TadD
MKYNTLYSLLIASLALSGLGLSGCAATPSSEFSAADELAVDGDPVLLGDNAARRGDYEAALTHYIVAIDAQETPDPEVWFRVGAVCTHIGKRQQALQAYLQVVDLNPEHAGGQEGAGLELMGLQAMDQARDHLVAAVTLDPQRWRAHNGLGILADRNDDYAAAIEHYQTALAINTNSPMILNNVGYSRYLSGDLEQAARDFYRVTELRPDYTPAWSNLGLVYARQGWYADAVNILNRSMDIATAHNNVGSIALRNGDLADAEQLLSEAIRLSPTYYEGAYQNLAVVRARMRSEGAYQGISPNSLNRSRIAGQEEVAGNETSVLGEG